MVTAAIPMVARLRQAGPGHILVSGNARQHWLYRDDHPGGVWPHGEAVEVHADELLYLAATRIETHARYYPLRIDHTERVIGAALRNASYKPSGGRLTVVTVAHGTEQCR